MEILAGRDVLDGPLDGDVQELATGKENIGHAGAPQTQRNLCFNEFVSLSTLLFSKNVCVSNL